MAEGRLVDRAPPPDDAMPKKKDKKEGKNPARPVAVIGERGRRPDGALARALGFGATLGASPGSAAAVDARKFPLRWPPQKNVFFGIFQKKRSFFLLFSYKNHGRDPPAERVHAREGENARKGRRSERPAAATYDEAGGLGRVDAEAQYRVVGAADVDNIAVEAGVVGGPRGRPAPLVVAPVKEIDLVAVVENRVDPGRR